MNGRERYFKNYKSYRFIGVVAAWPSGQKPNFFSLEEAGVQVQIPVWLLPGFFFLSSFFYPLPFSLFLLTADPVSFARFLRKRISSFNLSVSSFVSFSINGLKENADI